MKFLNFRFDYLGLSSEDKPSEVVNGSTFYEVDTSKLYIYYKGTWYEQGATADEGEPSSEVRKDEEPIIDEPIIENPIVKEEK